MAQFKVGDRVVAISNYMGKEIQGKTGTVKGFGSAPQDPIGVEWDDFADGHNGCGFFSGKRGCCWFVPENCIERLARRDRSIHITTDGKTTHAVLKDGGKVSKRAKAVCSPHDEFDFETGARIAFDRLCTSLAENSAFKGVREVKRQAKVGEWVRVIRDNGGQVKSGTVWKVTGVDNTGLDLGAWRCDPDNYVVLEGYPEPEKPTYYNGKVVCVDDCGYPDAWTKGRVYVFVDGVATSDKGWKTSCYKTLEHANGEKGGIGVGAKFIEYKGEA